MPKLKISGFVLCFVILAAIIPSLGFSIPGGINSIAYASATDEVRSDFNGDGYDDLTIGVPGEDVGSVLRAGAVNVIYGSESGLQTSSPADQLWTQNTASVEETAEDSDSFGSVLASGDFNTDGFADLAVGVPGESVGSDFGAGGVNVLYGSSTGLRVNTAGDGTGRPDQFWSQDSPGVEDEAEEGGERFGTAIAVGDFNNDGKDDLAIGAYNEILGGADKGAVNVLYGSSAGLQTSSPADQFWTQDSPNVEDSSENTDEFGTALASADFNGDGYDDLAISNLAENFGDIQQAGSVNVLYGSSSGLQAVSPADQFWHQDSPGIEDSVEIGTEGFGTSLAAGDFNNDGLGDLAIGVPNEERNINFSEGAIHVLYGSSSGLQTSSPADQIWTQESPGVEESSDGQGDVYGHSLISGDFNGDDFTDLAIGIPGEVFSTKDAAGAVEVLYGSSAGLQAKQASDGTGRADQLWTQDSPGVDNSAGDADWLGCSLAAGDFNGDGSHDLAIGVPLENSAAGIDSGAVNLIYGASSGLQTSAPQDQFWTQNSAGVNDSTEEGDRFGTFNSLRC